MGTHLTGLLYQVSSKAPLISLRVSTRNLGFSASGPKGLLELSVEVLGFRGFRVQVAIDYAQGSGRRTRGRGTWRADSGPTGSRRVYFSYHFGSKSQNTILLMVLGPTSIIVVYEVGLKVTSLLFWELLP